MAAMNSKRAERAKHFGAIVVAVVFMVVIVWIDLTTTIWQEVVILAGLAAGLVTFLLTVLVLDRVIARSTARRWAPVNRLALSEFLHELADEHESEISRGVIVPRKLPALRTSHDSEEFLAELLHLRELVVKERRHLSELLSRWASFLASSGDNETVLLHVADIAWSLDKIRDAALEVESTRNEAGRDELQREIARGNELLDSLTAELKKQLATK